MHGFDVTWMSCIVLEHGAQLLDAGGQRSLRHDGTRPHLLEQLVLRHDFAGAGRERAQQCERFRGDMDFPAAARQSLHGVQPKPAEVNLPIRCHQGPHRELRETSDQSYDFPLPRR